MIDKMPPQTWDEEADIIIVGSGFAGLAAAIEARRAGSSVIILEKMKGYGGNSTISDGVIAAAGTSMQTDSEITDSAQLMYEDMLKAGLGLNQPKLIRILTEKSSETFQWTIDFLGVKYLNRIDQFGGHSVRRCYTTSYHGRCFDKLESSGAQFVSPADRGFLCGRGSYRRDSRCLPFGQLCDYRLPGLWAHCGKECCIPEEGLIKQVQRFRVQPSRWSPEA